MASINMKSVFTSGLIAGVVISIIGAGLVPIVGKEMDTILENHGLSALSGGAMAYFGILSLSFGIILIWLYAALRPRFGSGIKTAVIVSTVVWFLAYFSSNVSMVAYGFMPLKITVIGTAWGLLELLAGGIIGARLYKEQE
jgi:hypothetical protein